MRFCSVFFPNWEVWKIVNLLVCKIHWNCIISPNVTYFFNKIQFHVQKTQFCQNFMIFSQTRSPYTSIDKCSKNAENCKSVQKSKISQKLHSLYQHCVLVWVPLLLTLLTPFDIWIRLFCMVNIEFIDKFYMLPVWHHSNKWPLHRHVLGWCNKESSS